MQPTDTGPSAPPPQGPSSPQPGPSLPPVEAPARRISRAPASQTQAPAEDQQNDDPRAQTVSPGLSALLGFGIAAGACFAFGWLGYQLVTRLGPQPPGPLFEGSAPSGALSGSPAAPEASPLPNGRSSQAGSAISPSGLGADPASLQASQLCLASGPAEASSPADPSNYGPRLVADWQGRAVPHTPQLIVLHETVVGERSALELFRRRHGDDAQQASYHVLIGRDGRRIRVVDDGQRAYGAGDSAFDGFSVQLKPASRPSINNIALHVSLVSPDDGADGEASGHAGYTAEQYRSLATQIALWQARYGIPASRVVTHQEVDRSGSRRDPRSFDWGALGRDLRSRWVACGGSAQLADLGRAAGSAAPRQP